MYANFDKLTDDEVEKVCKELLHAWPDRYDLDKIGEALQKDGKM